MTVAVDIMQGAVPTVSAPLMPEVVKTRRGVNLGCGTVCLPCERPHHHLALPENLYTAPDIKWDNVDRNAVPGVSHALDLFTYPWALPSNTYDVAICSHIVEHIPHHIIWNGAQWGDYDPSSLSPAAREMVLRFGQIIPRHPKYQDGWFAWFSELYRIMKPGGKAFVLVPYAWSNGGISDPTHTRYITWATMNYFTNATDEDPAFRYAMDQYWEMDLPGSTVMPHQMMMARAETQVNNALAYSNLMTLGQKIDLPEDVTGNFIMTAAQMYLNAVTELMFEIEAIK